jgi:acyl transferase domain-containing protein
LPDALRLVARRGALMQAQPPAACFRCGLALDDLLRACRRRVAGGGERSRQLRRGRPARAIADFQAQLEPTALPAARCGPRTLSIRDDGTGRCAVPRRSRGVEAFRTHAADGVDRTGDWLDAASATVADYWARTCANPCGSLRRWARCSTTPSRVLLEVGPRASLSALSRQHPACSSITLPPWRRSPTPLSETGKPALAAGQLWARGVALDPAMSTIAACAAHAPAERITFERQRFWVGGSIGQHIERASRFLRAPSTPVPPPSSAMRPRRNLVVAGRADGLPAAGTGRRPQRGPRHAAESDVRGHVGELAFPIATKTPNFIELGLDS